MGTYIPHTDDEVATMLAFLGLDSVDELFAVVPEALRLHGAWSWPTGPASPTCWPTWRGWPTATGPGPTAWSASPAAAPTTTRSRR